MVENTEKGTGYGKGIEAHMIGCRGLMENILKRAGLI